MATRLFRLVQLIKLAAFVAVVTCTCSASAITWYVNNETGDDRLNGRVVVANELEQTGPFRTIGRALHTATTGDNIALTKTEQPYRESISLVGTRHSGTSLRPFVIEGNGAILDGSTAIADRWEPVVGDVFRTKLHRMNYQQLFLDGLPAVRSPGLVTPKSLTELQPKEWMLDAGYLYFRTEETKIPLFYKPSVANQPVGITLYQVEHVIIRDLTVQGYQVDGVQVHDAGIDAAIMLSGITARGNGRSGIATVGASRAIVDASLVGNNGQAQILVSGPADAAVTNCDVLDNTSPKYQVKEGSLMIDGQLFQPSAASTNAAHRNSKSAAK